MKKRLCSLWVSVGLLLFLPGCRLLQTGRETIFDKIVSIPKDMVLDVPYVPPLCDELVGLKKGFADVKDGRLYYEEEGDGVPLVLIHGGPGSTHQGFHPYFSQIKDVARVIYYDQRGTGRSSSDDTGKTYTIKQAVEDLESLRQELKIDRWVVLGHSYGGLLAQCYALTYPDHCLGIVLAASETGLYKKNRKSEREHLFLSQAELDAIEQVKKKWFAGKLTNVQAFYNMQLRGQWKRERYYKPTKEENVRKALYGWNPAPGFEMLMRLNQNKIDLKGKFDDFEVPTLIVEGKWELLWWDTDRVEQMRINHPHAQIEVFEKSGHSMFADELHKFFTLLKSFLQKTSTMRIAYKSCGIIAWPPSPSHITAALAVSLGKDGDAKRSYMNAYEDALKENLVDMDFWLELADKFIKHAPRSRDYFEKTLIILQQCERSIRQQAPETWDRHGYIFKAWQGQMLDLLGRRDEAMACYKRALSTNHGQSNSWFSELFQINKVLLEKRLRRPFSWEEQ